MPGPRDPAADLAAELGALLAATAAEPAYCEDVAAYLRARPAERVAASAGVPRLKVGRVLAQLADAEPGLAVARVRVEAVSGCSDVAGTLEAVDRAGAARRFAFRWDCRWRAQREGWTTASGAPDQARAAAEFGWRCFAEWRHLP